MKPAPLAPELEADLQAAFDTHGARFGHAFEACVALAVLLPWYTHRAALPTLVPVGLGVVLTAIAMCVRGAAGMQRRRAAPIMDALRDRPDLVRRIACRDTRIEIRLATGASAVMRAPAWRTTRLLHELAARCPDARVVGRELPGARVVP